uniref:ANK_REP_REGION domain-containing protein n=1 Tax=Macrostomum lignano TaxID=282301 RepID=A0A1I8F839_9PLAT
AWTARCSFCQNQWRRSSGNHVFRVQTAHKGAQFLRDPSIGIIENVITGRRLKVRQDCDYHKRSSPTTMGPTMESIQCDDAQLRQVEAEQQKVDSDNAFKLVKVESEAVDAYSMLSGENSRRAALEETRASLKQKMMRSLKIHKPTAFINAPISRVIDCALDMAEEIVRQEESPGVVYHYLMGRSSKNRFYIARYFGLMHSLVDLRKDEGRSVMMALNQFVEDNRIIVDRITEAHVNTLIDLLQEWKNYLFLIFLTSYCTEQGLCLFRTGQSINRIRNLLYISTDTGRTYIPMHVFVDFNSPVYSESSFRYLVQQLNRDGGALCVCHSSVPFQCAFQRAIRTVQPARSAISKAFSRSLASLELINWDSAFLCLRSDIHAKRHPSQVLRVRKKPVPQANETLPQPEFDEVPGYGHGASSSSIEFEMQTSKGGACRRRFRQRGQNTGPDGLGRESTCSRDNFAENVFLKQVFELIAVLVKFGFYSEQVACARLSDTILEVLDGRTDYPSLKLLRDEHRAESEKAPAQASSDASERPTGTEPRCAAIDVLTLIMDQNQCLGEYIRLFIAAKHYRQEEANLRICHLPVINMQRFQSVMLDLALYSSTMIWCRKPRSDVQWGKHNCRRMIRILRELAGYCRYQGQPHLINQMIILSHDAMDLVDGILSRPPHTFGDGESVTAYYFDALHPVISAAYIRRTNTTSCSKKWLNFIDVWCRGNDVISQQVFQRMPFILSLEHKLCQHCAAVHCVFQQCAAFQEQMTERDFKQIIDIAIKCQRKLPEVFYLLIRSTYSSSTADLNLRNISIIIKLVMENYSRMGGISGDWRAWKEALEDPESSDYYLAFLELLTCCCRTDRSFIESMCMKMFRLEDVAVLIRFFDEVFVSAASTAWRLGFDELPVQPRTVAADAALRRRHRRHQLPQEEICMIMKAQEVKQPAGNFNVMSGMELKVNYIMDGLLPMTVSLLSRVFYPMALTDESAKASFEHLLSSLNSFACAQCVRTHESRGRLNRVSRCTSELVKMIDAAKDALHSDGLLRREARSSARKEEDWPSDSHFARRSSLPMMSSSSSTIGADGVYEAARNTVEASRVHGVR